MFLLLSRHWPQTRARGGVPAPSAGYAYAPCAGYAYAPSAGYAYPQAMHMLPPQAMHIRKLCICSLRRLCSLRRHSNEIWAAGPLRFHPGRVKSSQVTPAEYDRYVKSSQVKSSRSQVKSPWLSMIATAYSLWQHRPPPGSFAWWDCEWAMPPPWALNERTHTHGHMYMHTYTCRPPGQ